MLRIAFAVLMILAIRERAVWYRLGQASTADPMQTLAARVTALGFQVYGPENGMIYAVTTYALAADCKSPVYIGLFALDGGEDARFAAFLQRGMQPVFIYLGTVEARSYRLQAITNWSEANAEAVLGLRHTRAPNKMAVAFLPQHCPQLLVLDWRSLSPAD